MRPAEERIGEREMYGVRCSGSRIRVTVKEVVGDVEEGRSTSRHGQRDAFGRRDRWRTKRRGNGRRASSRCQSSDEVDAGAVKGFEVPARAGVMLRVQCWRASECIADGELYWRQLVALTRLRSSCKANGLYAAFQCKMLIMAW